MNLNQKPKRKQHQPHKEMKHKKDKNIIQLRAISEKAIADVDMESRKVKGYFASFNTLDSHRDIIRQGAFSKSIQERGPGASGNRRIAHLYQHDMNCPIGKILELREDGFGLYFVSQLAPTQKGNDVLTMYQEGVLREHSIGFNYVMDKMEFIEGEDEEGYFEIKEVKLFEGSVVTFGSNENTPYLGSSKSLTIEEKIEKLNQDLTANVSLLKSGKGSDELLQAAEYNIKIIQKTFNDLLSTPSIEAVKDTLKVKEPQKGGSNFFAHLVKEEEEKLNFFKHLNTGK